MNQIDIIATTKPVVEAAVTLQLFDLLQQAFEDAGLTRATLTS